MTTIKKAIKDVLQKENKALHYKDITRIALEHGSFETTGKTPEATINAIITQDIKTKGNNSDFIKISPSVYALNHHKNIEEMIEKEIEDKEEEKIKIESGFVGKAGEHLVCSELLFRGFNASIMSVDVGIDIVATKENSLISIQVKTANLNKFNTYIFDVRKASFERHNANNVYYIFVLHGDDKDNFIILPFFEMERKIKERAALPILNGERYRISIKERNGKIYLGKKEYEVDYYLNNRDIIK